MKKILYILLLSTAQLAFAQPLFTFEKGEVIPAHAIRIEKKRPQELTFYLPASKDSEGDESGRIKTLLEAKLQSYSGIKLKVENPTVLKLEFQGPDTPLLQALSKIDVSR